LGFLLSVVLRNSEGMISGEALGYEMSQNGLMLIYLFMVPVVVMFFGLSGSCTEFIGERRLLRQESSLGIPALYYLGSKLLVLMVWTAVEVYLFLWVSMKILEIPGPYHWFWGLAYLTAFVAVALGLLISAVAPNARVAYALVPMILIPQLVFSGVVPYEQMNPAIYVGSEEERDDAPLVGDLMASRWCYEGLVVAMAQENPFRERLRLVDECQRNIAADDWKARDALWEERREVLEMKALCENAFVRRLFERGNDRYLACQSKLDEGASAASLERRNSDERGVVSAPENVLFAGERSLFQRTWSAPAFAGGVLVAQGLGLLGLCLVALIRLRRHR
jgi:hypothetical protein